MQSHLEIKDALKKAKSNIIFLKAKEDLIDPEVRNFDDKHPNINSEYLTLEKTINENKELDSKQHQKYKQIIFQQNDQAANNNVAAFDEINQALEKWQQEKLSRIKQKKDEETRFTELKPIYEKSLQLHWQQTDIKNLIATETKLYHKLKTDYFFAYGRYKAEQNKGFINALAENDMRKAESFLKAGADINGIGDDFLSPLFRAIKEENTAQVAWLLEHKANPNQTLEYLPSFKGITPFIATVAWTYDNSAIARYLLAYEANINMGDAMQFTPLHAAMYFLSEPHVNFLLLLRKAKVKIDMMAKDIHERTPLDILEEQKATDPHAYTAIKKQLEEHFSGQQLNRK